MIDHGSHYGFVENGVVLSKLQPGLATVVVFDDGRVDLGTWTKQDDADLPRIRHARQNGVAILERDAGSQRTVPGSRVRDWGPGNWSGSADKKLRTLRAGLCLQESQGKQFLVYGYFSSATPSSMARVFQASGCRYAMLLDMNALEHTYMAVYRMQGSRLLTQHLIDGMERRRRLQGRPAAAALRQHRRQPGLLLPAAAQPSVNRTARLVGCVALLALARPAAPAPPSAPQRNEDLLRELQQVHGLSDESMRRIREVFAGSTVIGQGNPAVTEHPATPEACVAKLREAGVSYEQPESDRICGARYMAPLYAPLQRGVGDQHVPLARQPRTGEVAALEAQRTPLVGGRLGQHRRRRVQPEQLARLPAGDERGRRRARPCHSRGRPGARRAAAARPGPSDRRTARSARP